MWKSIDNLREIPRDIAGGYYSRRYLKKQNVRGKVWGEIHTPKKGYGKFFYQPLRVREAEGEVQYRFEPQGDLYPPQKEVFETSKGRFYSQNNGEFGGTLTTPREKINGNFKEVIECDGYIYALDSLSFLSVRETEIYTFSKTLKSKRLYSSLNQRPRFFHFFRKKKEANLALAGVFQTEKSVYVLLYGEYTYRDGKNNGVKTEEASLLFELKRGKIVRKTRFDFALYYVRNFIVRGNEMIVGADKSVSVIDLKTKRRKILTNLNDFAVSDIYSA